MAASPKEMQKAVVLTLFSTLLVLGTAADPSGAQQAGDDHPDIQLFFRKGRATREVPSFLRSRDCVPLL